MTEGQEIRQFKPKHVFDPVNKKVVRRYLNFAMGGLGISGIGRGVSVRAIYDLIPQITNEAGLKQSFLEAQPLFNYSIFFSLIAGLLFLMILIRLFDAQWILSVAKILISLTFFYILASLISFLPQSLFLAYKILFGSIVMFYVLYILSRGMITFYWTKRSYGDVFIQMLLLGIFLYFMWHPIKIIFLGGKLL